MPETSGRDERPRIKDVPRQVADAPATGEAVPETPSSIENRLRAWQVLKTHPMWQEPGCAAWVARSHHDPFEPIISVFYRIRIDRVTGHEATRVAKDAIPYTGPAPLAGR